MATAAAALLGVGLPVALPVGIPGGPAPAGAATPQTISADALPTPQVNGIVYSVAIVGSTVFAAGSFTAARPSGTPAGGPGEVPRVNLLAFDLASGSLLPFQHTVTGTPFISATDPGGFCRPTLVVANQYLCDAVYRVKASPDHRKIYIAGDFTAVDGQPRSRLAAFDVATGALDPTFHPSASSRVRALAVGPTAVYLGGSFTAVDGVTRSRLAAVDLTGRLLPGFAPAVDADVWSEALTADGATLVVGGAFTTVNRVAQHTLTALSTANGARRPWVTNQVFTAGDSTTVTDIAVDGGTAFVSGYGFRLSGPANLEGRAAFSIANGALVWDDDCRGDTQSIAVAGGVVYSASHAHACAPMRGFPQLTANAYQRILAETEAVGGISPLGRPVPTLLPVFPNVDAGPPGNYFRNGPWAVAADGRNVVYGGEFLDVNGVAQQGLTRFVVRSAAPQRSGPVAPIAAPTVASLQPGTATVSFPTTWDRDDPELTYQIQRDGVTVHSVTVASSFWRLPAVAWTDTGLTPGSTPAYRVRVSDSSGNQAGGSATSVVVAAAPAADYPVTVLADGAEHYWRFGETPGATVTADQAGAAPLDLGTGVVLGRTAGIPGADAAATFTGGVTGIATSAVTEAAPGALTLEAWFATTSQAGGELVGLGDSTGAVSGTDDRLLHLMPDGLLALGVRAPDGTLGGISSSRVYNDGGWHHAVATLDDAGAATLYVDGRPVASGPLPQTAFTGYWRVGGDRLLGWPGLFPATPAGRGYPWPASNTLAGFVDDVAVYSRALPASTVLDHFVRGVSPTGGAVPIVIGTPPPPGPRVPPVVVHRQVGQL